MTEHLKDLGFTPSDLKQLPWSKKLRTNKKLEASSETGHEIYPTIAALFKLTRRTKLPGGKSWPMAGKGGYDGFFVCVEDPGWYFYVPWILVKLHLVQSLIYILRVSSWRVVSVWTGWYLDWPSRLSLIVNIIKFTNFVLPISNKSHIHYKNRSWKGWFLLRFKGVR